VTHDIARLEKDIKSFHAAVRAFAEDDDYVQLLKFIHQPGWTTPAEFLLVHASINAMHAQVRELTTMKNAVINASQQMIEAGERVGV
jgi:hypothetical protein